MEDEELLVGLNTMRSWGVIDKNFPRLDSTAFHRSKEDMDAIQLRIAVIEKSIESNSKSEEKTNQGETCVSEKHASSSEEQNKNTSTQMNLQCMIKMKTKKM